MPTSSRIVSALCSMIERPSSPRTSNGASVRVRNGSRSTWWLSRTARRPSRPPVRRLPIARSSVVSRSGRGGGGGCGGVRRRAAAAVRRRRRSARASPPRSAVTGRAGRVTTRSRLGLAAVRCGIAIASTKCSWKRGSTAVSIFSTRRTTASISRRAAPDSRAISAPVPAALPAALTRDRSQSGTRPRTIAWSGSIWLPNAPASRTSSTVSISRWSMSSRTPAYSAAFASWIARTSFWVTRIRGPSSAGACRR